MNASSSSTPAVRMCGASKTPHRHRFRRGIIVAIVLLAGAGTGWWFQSKHEPASLSDARPIPAADRPASERIPAAKPAQSATAIPSTGGAPAGVTPDEWRGVMAQIRAERRAFHAASDGGLDANGPAGENLQLGRDGSAVVTVGREPKKPDPADARSPVARIASLSAPGEPAVTLSMKPMSIGRANHATPLAATTPSAVERYRAERLVADGVTEWWRSEEEGLEFGWDLAMRPAGDGPLRIDLAR